MLWGLLLLPGALQGASAQTEATVYNQGFAVVKESRQLNLKKGRQTVSVRDVAALIEANSVGIRPTGDPGAFQVLEQNYRYDLINPLSILQSAVGSPIKLHRVLPDGKKETLLATLVSAPTAILADPSGRPVQIYTGMVLRKEDGSVVLDPTGEVEVLSIPSNMVSRPTLEWEVDSQVKGTVPIELSYLTQGMTWNADYVLTLDGVGTADLLGWVTMANNSGATFKDAKLKLLAGDVHRAQPDHVLSLMKSARMEAMERTSDFKEESLFEYHLYTLQRPATIRNKEIKQLSLLEGHGVKVTKKLIVDSMRDFGMYYPGEGEVGTGNLKPQVRMEFVNSKANGLGIPLPKGSFKVCQRDKSGSVQMLGEDQIDHTPKDEKVSLVVGRSFDVVAERKRMSFQRIGPHGMRETFQIELRNRKAVPDQVFVLERHFGDWTVTRQSAPFKKLDSTTMQFIVSLKAGETKTVTYSVDTRW